MQKLVWIIPLAIGSFQGMGVRAAVQTTATCANTFAWSFNSMNQSPCLVAAYLLGACTAGEWTVPALPITAGGTPIGYSAPTLENRSLCSCSWAVYNLLSACDACQGGSWITWPSWEFNCTVSGNMVSSEAFPPSESIPSQTVIPLWAAKDPNTWTGSFFNTTEAQAAGSQDYIPPSSASASQTSTATSSSSSTPSAGGSNGPAVGPIVGGVVGGLLGILLIVVLAIWLLCPTVFRRRRIATTDIGYPSKKELQPSVSSTPIHIPGGTPQYDTGTVSTSRQQLIAPGASRPPLHQQFTSSTYSVGTSVEHTTPSIPLQHMLPTAPTPPHLNGAVNISPPPTSTGSIYTPPIPEAVASDTTSSIRTFFTRASHRQGHSHTPSDTSITSSSTLLPRIQQGLWRQQRPGEEVVPYILPSSTGDTSTSGSTGTASPPLHGYPVDRKQRITGLQYTPPPPATPEENSDMATMGLTPTTGVNAAPSVIPGMTDVYGALGSSIVDGEIDRRTNMSPANASSILEAAPPYVTDDRHEIAGRRHAARLADVQEYPDEKSRFMNAEREL